MHAVVTFTRLIQDSQEFGSDDEHMVSRVFFTLKVGDSDYPALHADVKQTVGAAFDSPLEVSAPRGYRGPMNHAEFRKAVDSYFRGLVGPTATSGLRLKGSMTRMRHNTFHTTTTAEFDVPPGQAGW